MPSIHFMTSVDAPPDVVYEALATEEGLAGEAARGERAPYFTADAPLPG